LADEESQRRALEAANRDLEQKRKEDEEKLTTERKMKEEVQQNLLKEQAKRAQEAQQAAQPPVQASPQTPTVGVTCDECQQPIAGSGIQALGKTWHQSCFKCEACKKPLTGSFMNTGGKPYCTEDFQRLFVKTCSGCGQNIQGPLIRAMGKEWHPQNCFVCVSCKGSLTGGFLDKGGKPYCKNCVNT